ncbi:MAG: hypothetical protein WCF10_05305, partial [Polyangiales bacterium]
HTHALRLMPNHIHLLLTPIRVEALGEFVQRVAHWTPTDWSLRVGEEPNARALRGDSAQTSDCDLWRGVA